MSGSMYLLFVFDVRDLNTCKYETNNSSLRSNLDQGVTVTSKWAWWRLKSPASQLFTQSFIQAQIKENIKAPRH